MKEHDTKRKKDKLEERKSSNKYIYSTLILIHSDGSLVFMCESLSLPHTSSFFSMTRLFLFTSSHHLLLHCLPLLNHVFFSTDHLSLSPPHFCLFSSLYILSLSTLSFPFYNVFLHWDIFFSFHIIFQSLSSPIISQCLSSHSLSFFTLSFSSHHFSLSLSSHHLTLSFITSYIFSDTCLFFFISSFSLTHSLSVSSSPFFTQTSFCFHIPLFLSVSHLISLSPLCHSLLFFLHILSLFLFMSSFSSPVLA